MSHDKNRHKAGEILMLVIFSTTNYSYWKGYSGVKLDSKESTNLTGRLSARPLFFVRLLPVSYLLGQELKIPFKQSVTPL